MIGRAVDLLQLGLNKYPKDKILNAKLGEWQDKLQVELSRHYKDGCIHAKYFRNLEAKHEFLLVMELSFDTSDIRYTESKRIVEELEDSPNGRISCGEL